MAATPQATFADDSNPRVGAGCCAQAPAGHAAAPVRPKNVRRFMTAPILRSALYQFKGLKPAPIVVPMARKPGRVDHALYRWPASDGQTWSTLQCPRAAPIKRLPGAEG